MDNSKTKAKKIKTLKYTIMASLQAKSGWKRPRKRKNKNYLSVQFLPDAKLKIKKKNSKKIQKIQKYHYGFISRQNRLEKGEKEIK